MKKRTKTVITILLNIVLIALIALVGLLLYGTVTEYKPAAAEPIETTLGNNSTLHVSDSWGFTLWNIGYTGLGSEQDFLLDGGSGKQATEEETAAYRVGIFSTLQGLSEKSDGMLLQEVDRAAKRSFKVDLFAELQELFPELSANYATNYRSFFVPIPLADPIGKVESGIATFVEAPVIQSVRYRLPSKSSWPVRLFHLKRCFTLSRVPVAGTKSELVLINAHFSAYGPELLPEQLRMVKELIEAEYAAGNYVVLGADWNQIPPVAGAGSEFYPLAEDPLYIPVEIPAEWTPEGWQWGVDVSTPTYRLLDKPYGNGNGADASTGTTTADQFYQVGVIDGFLVSPNLQILEVETIDMDFAYSDHNPVYLRVQPKE